MRKLQLLFFRWNKCDEECKGLKIKWLKWENCSREGLPEAMSTEFLTVIQIKFDVCPSRLTEPSRCSFPLSKLKSVWMFSPDLKWLRDLELIEIGDDYVKAFTLVDVGSLPSLERICIKGLSCFGQLTVGLICFNKPPSFFRLTAGLLSLMGLISSNKLPSSFGQLRMLNISRSGVLTELLKDFVLFKVWKCSELMG